MVGRLPVPPLVGLFVITALAGCLGDGKGGGGSLGDGEGDPDGMGGEAVFTQTTGAIGGYVLDVAFAPLAGATVSLTKDGKAIQNVTSDDTGSYAISEVEPGAYVLFANKTGYRPKSRPVTVAEGTLLRERFLLEEAPTVTPYIDPIEFRGFLECSTAPPNGKCTQSVPQDVPSNHRPSGNYAIKEGLQAVLLEMVWSTSRGTGVNDGGAGGAGGGMTLSCSWDSLDGDGSAPANGVNGQTIRSYMERRLNAAGEWKIFVVEGAQAGSEQPDWPMEGGGVVAFGGNPNFPNVVAQRGFEIYVSAFYHQMKPEGYTGLAEV